MIESQKILLQLLKEIDHICKQHGITYYLVGGSALGAVRHHGFIPWDDDADIVMDHENYMKFVEVMSEPKNLPPNRAYRDPFIAPYTHINSFGRYFTTDTTWIIRPYALCDYEQGIRVDIFHLIPCPDEGEEREAFMRKFRTWGEVCYPYARNKETDVSDWLSSVESLEEKGAEIIRKELFNDLNIEKYQNSSQYLYCYEKEHTFYNKEIFAEPVYFPFEDTVLPVPTKYTEHFRILFGDDWYRIPDTSDQESHSAIEDIQRGYDEYVSDYSRYVPAKGDLPFKEYKYNMFKNWEKQKEVDLHKAKIRKILVEQKISIFWQNHSNEIKEAIANKKYEKAIEIAKTYLDEQLSSYAVNNEIFLEVNKELFKLILEAYMYTSENKKARKLLQLAPDSYKQGEIRKLHDYLNEKDGLILMEEQGDDTELYEANEKLLQKHPDDRDLLLRKARILLRHENPDENETIKKICKRYANDGEFIGIVAKVLERQGLANQAVELYREAMQKTKNGMVIMDCKISIQRLKLDVNK